MASMKDIKTRIRSVESTQQITRAMELVATSKLRHARERVERSRPFHEVLGEAIAGIQAGLKETPSVYSEVRPVKKTCFVVIGGDRGLAGGYNANLHSTQGYVAERDSQLMRVRWWCESPVRLTVEPASELCVIEAWRVFPALTGVERAAGALLTGVVPPKSFGPL